MRRPTRALAAATCLAAAVVAVPSASQTTPLAEAAAPPGPSHAASAPALDWRRCGPRFECARMRVPLDHDRPQGRTISLALIKLPAARPARRIGTLFTNPGGPGEFGISFVRREAESAYPQRVRNRFDIVGFDPRGVGRSTPLRCFESAAQQWRFWGRVPIFPVTRAEERATITANLRYGARCEAADRDLLRHMSTGEVAQDLELMRRAVGDRRLTFAGYSYGSMVGLTYANRYRDRVRAVYVDGVVDPVSWIGRGRVGQRVPVDVRLKSDSGSEAALRGFLRACEQAADSCAFATGRRGARDKFDRLMRAVRRHPIRAGAGLGVVTYDVAVSDVVHGLYGFRPWPRVAAELQQLWRHRHDVAKAPAARVDALRPTRADLRASGYANYVDAAYGVTCGETDNPGSPAAWRRWADRRTRVSPHFGRYWAWLDGPCADWQVTSPDRYAGPFDRRTSTPVLFVSTLRDPATRYRDAVDAAARMPRSRLVTIDGTGHTSLTQDSRCADDAIADYLVGRDLPRRGLVCATRGGLFD